MVLFHVTDGYSIPTSWMNVFIEKLSFDKMNRKKAIKQPKLIYSYVAKSTFMIVNVMQNQL